MNVTDWIEVKYDHEVAFSYRARAGTTGEFISDRVAFVEKTPRVRIRPYTFADDYLNWCEGIKGSGPTDIASRQWCDKMLQLLGYELE